MSFIKIDNCCWESIGSMLGEIATKYKHCGLIVNRKNGLFEVTLVQLINGKLHSYVLNKDRRAQYSKEKKTNRK